MSRKCDSCTGSVKPLLEIKAIGISECQVSFQKLGLRMHPVIAAQKLEKLINQVLAAISLLLDMRRTNDIRYAYV